MMLKYCQGILRLMFYWLLILFRVAEHGSRRPSVMLPQCGRDSSVCMRDFISKTFVSIYSERRRLQCVFPVQWRKSQPDVRSSRRRALDITALLQKRRL